MDISILELVKKAQRDRIVVSQTLADGLTVFAYPVTAGALVGVGFDAGLARRIQPEVLLRKRAADMQRFGSWLPALFVDGSCYVIRRIRSFNPDRQDDVLSVADLQQARELMS